MRPNARVSAIAFSQTLALDARAKELARKGRDVVNLSVGEPDFDAPRAVRDAAHASIESGEVRYTPAAGRESLRATVAAHLSRTRGVPYQAAEVAICHSAKHALSGAVLSLVEPGDEVLLLLPAWVSYVEQIRFAGGVPVGVRPRSDLGPDLDALAASIGPRTRGLMLNSPSNPSGHVLAAEDIAAIGELCVRHDLWILSDEIYSRLVYGARPFASPVQLGPELRERTVLVDGASKAFAMTGYRIGYVAAPVAIASAVGRLHSQLTGSPNAISQAAFEAALRSEPPEVAEMVAEFDRRRRWLVARLAQIGLEAPEPSGAFYAFPDLRPWLDERGSEGFCEELLEREELALVPGTAFGMEGHVRISYSTSLAKLEEGMRRLERFLARRPRRSELAPGARGAGAHGG